MTTTYEADALFASPLQCSEHPSAETIRRTIAATSLRLGRTGCAEAVAAEFGDHPDTAVARMTWVLATVAAIYPRLHALAA
jgi:hypothetical protein